MSSSTELSDDALEGVESGPQRLDLGEARLQRRDVGRLRIDGPQRVLETLSCHGPRSVTALMRAETWTNAPPGANTVVNPMPTLPSWLKTAVPTTLDRGAVSH